MTKYLKNTHIQYTVGQSFPSLRFLLKLKTTFYVSQTRFQTYGNVASNKDLNTNSINYEFFYVIWQIMSLWQVSSMFVVFSIYPHSDRNVVNVGNIRKRIGRFRIVIKIINSRVNSFDTCNFNNLPFRNNMKYMNDLVV